MKSLSVYLKKKKHSGTGTQSSEKRVCLDDNAVNFTTMNFKPSVCFPQFLSIYSLDFSEILPQPVSDNYLIFTNMVH